MKYAYYPGCSLEVNSAAYDVSVRAVTDHLRVELSEIDDWNCCGATEYFSQDKLTATAVIARNLALVEKGLPQLIAPCAACFLNLKKTDKLMADDAHMNQAVNTCLAAGGLSYKPGTVTVRHLLDVLHDDVGEAAIRDKMVRPLKGLKIAPYYGCQWVRPFPDVDCTEQPVKMDNLFRWLGADVVNYPLKAHCCGGHMTQLSEPQAFELIRRILDAAVVANADLILCMCPMCQLNLDAYQSRVNSFFGANFKMPIIFFSQLIGVAFGIPLEQLGFGKEIVAARPVIESKLAAGAAA